MSYFLSKCKTAVTKLVPAVALIACLFGNALPSQAQENDTKRTPRTKEYELFLTRILSTNGANHAPVPSFLLDASENPTLKLSFPIYGFAHFNTSRHFVFFDGKVSSKNGYTALISKGGWLPDVDYGVDYTFLLHRNVWFYRSEIDAAHPIDEMPISKASRVAFGWFSLKGTHNYSKYTFYNDASGLALSDRLYSKEYNSIFLRASFNEYYFPSRVHRLLPTIFFNLGYEFRGNDNNYAVMDEVNVKQTTVYTDSTGAVMEVLSDETKARKGTFIHGTSHIIPANLSLLFHNADQTFYIGFSVYGQRRYINYGDGYQGSYDVGASINLPIQKSTDNGEKKTVANFTLRADLRDVGNDLLAGDQARPSFREKAKLGFTLGIPVMPQHR